MKSINKNNTKNILFIIVVLLTCCSQSDGNKVIDEKRFLPILADLSLELLDNDNTYVLHTVIDSKIHSYSLEYYLDNFYYNNELVKKLQSNYKYAVWDS